MILCSSYRIVAVRPKASCFQKEKKQLFRKIGQTALFLAQQSCIFLVFSFWRVFISALGFVKCSPLYRAWNHFHFNPDHHHQQVVQSELKKHWKCLRQKHALRSGGHLRQKWGHGLRHDSWTGSWWEQVSPSSCETQIEDFTDTEFGSEPLLGQKRSGLLACSCTSSLHLFTGLFTSTLHLFANFPVSFEDSIAADASVFSVNHWITSFVLFILVVVSSGQTLKLSLLLKTQRPHPSWELTLWSPRSDYMMLKTHLIDYLLANQQLAHVTRLDQKTGHHTLHKIVFPEGAAHLQTPLSRTLISLCRWESGPGERGVSVCVGVCVTDGVSDGRMRKKRRLQYDHMISQMTQAHASYLSH